MMALLGQEQLKNSDINVPSRNLSLIDFRVVNKKIPDSYIVQPDTEICEIPYVILLELRRSASFSEWR